MDFIHESHDLTANEGVIHAVVGHRYPVAHVGHGVQGCLALALGHRQLRFLRQPAEMDTAGVAVAVRGVDEDLQFAEIAFIPARSGPQAVSLIIDFSQALAVAAHPYSSLGAFAKGKEP